MNTAAADCIVLGAGLMGRLLAHRLAERGHRVAVHEAGSAEGEGAAAKVAAAMLAPLAESAISELPVVRMGLHALQRWPALIATLPEPVHFQQAGTLIVWHRQDASEAQRFAALLERTCAALPQIAPPRALDASGLAQLEPALAGRFPRALLLPGEGQLDNRALLQSLRRGLELHPRVRLHWGDTRKPSDFTAALRDGAWLFDCRGLGARPQWSSLRGVRGEVIRLHAPGVRLQRPTRLVHPRYPIYIAPKPGDIFVVGATEIESEDLSPASVRSTLELLSAAYTVDPGFGEARVLEIGVQARPTLPDHLPALRARGPRQLSINGLYRHGFLMAPALLDAALQWMEQGDSPLARDLGIPLEHDAGEAQEAAA